MPAGDWSKTMYQGDDFTYTLTWSDDDENAVDLSGYTIYYSAKKTQTSSSFIFNYNTNEDDEISITDADSGQFTIDIGGGTISNFDFFNAIHEVVAVSSSGERTKLLHGELTLSREVGIS